MKRKLYQLVAIDKQGNEYIIELINDNKNNKAELELLDFGTTKFKNENHLANYLLQKGKIPHMDVNFAIKYNRDGVKYLPVIYDDFVIHSVAKNIIDNYSMNGYNGDLEIKLETALFSDKSFYKYLIIQNNANKRKQKNGHYLDNQIINNITNFYNEFVVPHNINGNKSEIRKSLYNELLNYKQLRTLHMFYLDVYPQFKVCMPERNKKIEGKKK